MSSYSLFLFFFNDTATTEIYTSSHTLSLHDALPISNAAAKNLRTLRTAKLLVTVPDISNPFFSLILQGIEDAAQRGGYSVLVGDTQHDDQREERYALMLKRKEADGLIVLGHRLPGEAAALVRAM